MQGPRGRSRSGRTPLLLLVLLLLSAPPAFAQRPTPAPPQTKSILITGGTVHVGDGRVIDEGAVGFRNGVIDYVGYAYGVVLKYDSIVDVKGQHVYPGFVAVDATLGLAEIDQARATDDLNETGDMTPEVRAITAYNTDSRIIPTVRNNGVLLAQIAPRTGTIAGTSCIVQLDAWDNQSAIVRADDGIHMTWPRAYQRTGWWAEPGETSAEKEDERSKQLRELRMVFAEAKAYKEWIRSNPTKVDIRKGALLGLFDGSKTLFVNASVAREIQEAVLFVKEMGIKKLVIVGGYDAWRVADLLRDNHVDVILRRLHSLPLRDDEDVDLPYRLPALLQARGIRFALSYTGDKERIGMRNLPFVAGTAAAYGLAKEEALASITLDAARILGIDSICGSLATGKQATLFVSTGDALDMRTNNVVHAFIQGRRISLADHQKALYRQYSERYGKP
ncbi:MAG: amidohydrolase family protein [Flavobacteriales bacterium]|nr:amidohydrolase family protein [Flavobacteriales bacterium]